MLSYKAKKTMKIVGITIGALAAAGVALWFTVPKAQEHMRAAYDWILNLFKKK
jgi:hypothetical protein